jgi:hypothetical protein
MHQIFTQIWLTNAFLGVAVETGFALEVEAVFQIATTPFESLASSI